MTWFRPKRNYVSAQAVAAKIWQRDISFANKVAKKYFSLNTPTKQKKGGE